MFLIFLLSIINISFCAPHPKDKNNEKNKSVYCYVNDIEPYVNFGSKTAYEFVSGSNVNSSYISHCKPIQFWGLIRHGARFPTESSVKKLKSLIHTQGEIRNNSNKHLCDNDSQLFETWVWDTNMEKDPGNLTAQGVLQLIQLAERQKLRYPQLLGIPYSVKDFTIRYTESERTKLSSEAFISGLFENTDNIHGKSYSNDTLLKPYYNCPYWVKNVKENPQTRVEYNKFLARKKFKQLVKQVSKRLGFEHKLNASIILNMYSMCAYEKSWYINQPSTWCAAFTKKQLKMLEYGLDLKDYYENSYGNEVNKKLACLLIKDFMGHFENVINGSLNEPKSVLYFAHSAILQMLMTTMGMYEDEITLMGNNIKEEKHRLWRTSLLHPFAANMNAVLYKCNKGEEHRVMFVINEKPARYSNCPNGICSWSVLRNKLEKFSENCNLDFCQI